MAQGLLSRPSMTTSTVHESVLLWLRDDPSRLSSLLVLTGHPPCPPMLTVEDSALRVIVPIEVSPDLVLRDLETSEWVLVEVQRRPDEAKARRWPMAMAAMADRHGPRGELVVITASAAVARWRSRGGLLSGPKTSRMPRCEFKPGGAFCRFCTRPSPTSCGAPS